MSNEPETSSDSAAQAGADHEDPQAWAAEFAVTASQISDAIAAVGNRKADVEMYLKGSHSTTDSDVAKRAG